MFVHLSLLITLLLQVTGREDVSIEQMYNLLQSGSIDLMLDVRTYGEYVLGHISCAKNEPVQSLAETLLSGKYDEYKNQTVGLICSAGIRSARAADIFEVYEFQDIVNTIQGMDAWIATGLPYVETLQAEPGSCEE
eukprot:TRINITY_DN346_c1_g1_i1.p3 TRINITY_DN346_c1_g1~~TRINITY_DN346_c1_g1_i1.p3  ORF type:complete len:136 (-),score=25.20 TRINITY_DN346_c1_g1_i1:845-1252(-)